MFSKLNKNFKTINKKVLNNFQTYLNYFSLTYNSLVVQIETNLFEIKENYFLRLKIH